MLTISSTKFMDICKIINNKLVIGNRPNNYEFFQILHKQVL